MPSVASAVGPLPLPAAVGAPDAPIGDPTEEAILDYCAFWIKWALDAKIATMTVPGLVTPGDMVPVANRYTQAPNALLMARKLPALFVWWDGKSTKQRVSTVKTCREREFSFMYVFERLRNVDQLNTYSGLMPTVGAALSRAFDRLAHPAYALAGSGFAPGTDIRIMFGLRGVEYLGDQEGFLKELPQQSQRTVATAANPSTSSAQGGIQQGYPSLQARVRVWEVIEQDSLSDLADATKDMKISINVGDPANPLPYMQRVLQQPDGSQIEDPDQVGKS